MAEIGVPESGIPAGGAASGAPGAGASGKQAKHQSRVGRVKSNKMDKTVVVTVEVRKRHPLYRRTIRRTVSFMAHDENNACQIGDLVRIVETRPLSRHKRWRVAEILQTGAITGPVAGDADVAQA